MYRLIYLFSSIFLLYCYVFSQQKTLCLEEKTFVLENDKWFVLDGMTNDKFEINKSSITVKLKNGLNKTAISSINESLGVKIENSNKLGFIDLKLPEGADVFDVYDKYKNSGLCDIIEINSYGKSLITPEDPKFNDQYYLNHPTRPDINAPEAWNICFGNNSIIIAVIDDGIQLNPQHVDHNLWPDKGWDFVDDDSDPDAQGYSHGTHVAGVAAALTNNGIGVSGIAGGWYQNGAQIMAIRVIYYQKVNDIIYSFINSRVVDDAIIYAADHGAKIINMSFKVDQLSSINSALQYAYGKKGCLLVAAAGNDPSATSPYFPARESHVMAVAGIIWKNWLHYGNIGNEIEVAAPADDILNTIYGNTYGNFSGTSQAAPQVAGTAALIWTDFPNFINKDLRYIINETAEDIGVAGFDIEFGNGLLKVDQALSFEDFMPEKPSSISISAPIGGNPTITWNTVQEPGIYYYNIYRACSDLGRFELIKKAEVDHNPGLTTHSWTDQNVTVVRPLFAIVTYYYRVTSVDLDGYESIVSEDVSCGSNSLEKKPFEQSKNTVSYNYKLFKNYPNPFNPATTINYSLKEAGRVQIKVYDVLGRLVKELVNENKDSGIYSVVFNSSSISSGLYYYSMQANGYFNSKKMLLIK